MVGGGVGARIALTEQHRERLPGAFRAASIARSARSTSTANRSISLDTVGSDATRPNTAGIDRTCPISARQSPPIATAIAKSSSTFPGSCTADGRRHGSNAADIARSNPTVVAVVTSSTDPPIDTTR
jgi:hypothetical protein